MTEANYLFDKIFKPNETKEKIFLINESKKLTYIEFHEVVNKISNYLIEIDLSPGTFIVPRKLLPPLMVRR